MLWFASVLYLALLLHLFFGLFFFWIPGLTVTGRSISARRVCADPINPQHRDTLGFKYLFPEVDIRQVIFVESAARETHNPACLPACLQCIDEIRRKKTHYYQANFHLSVWLRPLCMFSTQNTSLTHCSSTSPLICESFPYIWLQLSETSAPHTS